MKLLDKAVRGLALRFAKGKVDSARKDGSAVTKLLDGNKRLILVIGFVVAGLVALVTGQDVSQWLDLGLRAIGWQDADLIATAKQTATAIVPLLWAIWAASHALWKMWRQHRAGATASELNSPAGVVKAAAKDGSLRALDVNPAVLEIAGAVVLAQPVK